MQKLLKTAAGLAASLTLLLTLALPAAADAGGITVTPVFPDNQNPGTAGYFDLTVAPGQTQDLEFVIQNKEDRDVTVSLHLITATTNSNGIVNYTSQGTPDETLAVAFSDIAAAPEDPIVVPALGSVRAGVRIEVPDEPFPGIALGSIQVLKELSEEERSSDAMILNQYSYVTAVRLRQGAGDVAPDFALGDVTAELINRQASIVAEIRNTEALLARDITVDVRILSGDTTVFERTRTGVEMAPNSVMRYRLDDEAGYGIRAGSYLAAVRLEYQGRVWEFERAFTVAAEEAAGINQNALNQTGQTALQTGLPTWAVIAITAGAVLLLLVLVALLLLLRRRRGNVIRVN